MPINPRQLPVIESSIQPTLLRARYVHDVVRVVNELSSKVFPARQTDAEIQLTGLRAQAEGTKEIGSDPEPVEDVPDAPILSKYVVWYELRRDTSSVRVFNPDDSEQFVDVDRIDRVLFVQSNGDVAELRFDNT